MGSCEAWGFRGVRSGRPGTQSIRSLENGVTNESLDAGGWAEDLSPSVGLGLRRHTLSSFSI